VIKPYQNLSISPAASALHYGIECFEGMKAYKDKEGRIRLFRPDMNMSRLDRSMRRLSMPPIEGGGFLDCLKALLRVDADWVPWAEGGGDGLASGYSLYLRPTAIGVSPYLGVQQSDRVKLFAMACPVGPYYKSGFKPVALFADTHNTRAWPGGAGSVKVGGNYAPTILPSREAMEKHGCSQVSYGGGVDWGGFPGP
jgi:branched-chain amino acid aminotransferase